MEDTSKLSEVVQLHHDYRKESAVLKVIYERTTFILEAPSELLTSPDGRSYSDLLNSYFHVTEDTKREHFLGILSSLRDLTLAPFGPIINALAQPTDSSRLYQHQSLSPQPLHRRPHLHRQAHDRANIRSAHTSHPQPPAPSHAATIRRIRGHIRPGRLRALLHNPTHQSHRERRNEIL